MRLRTVAKLGVVLSVVLFCIAVGFYGFTRLSMTDRGREFNLFSLVPSNSIGVLESDNINYFLNDFPQLNYSNELGDFQFPGLFDFILGGLKVCHSESTWPEQSDEPFIGKFSCSGVSA